MNLPIQTLLTMRWLTVFVVFAALALSNLVYGQDAAPRDTLGEGDSIRITVFQNPDLTTETRVSDRGTITFPLVREVALPGLTPAAAEQRIARKLIDGKYIL